MALFTFKYLVENDSTIMDYYKNATTIWQELFNTFDWKNVDAIADILTDKQTDFEVNCGYRVPGQEIMVISGFALLYDIQAGFKDNQKKAEILYDAFQKSYCSGEVKFEAENIAKLYNLIEG